MRKSLLILLYFIALQLHSQQNHQRPYTYGRLKADELKMQIYEKDTTANAVALFKYGQAKVVYHGGKIFIRTIYYGRIKILSKNGEDQATIKIPFYFKDKFNQEKVKNIRAITHNLSESSAILNKDQIFTSTITENYKEVSFTFPNVKPGSILEYEYTLESKYFYNFNGWEFQSDIPTVYSELHAIIPGNWIYNKRLIGLKKLDKEILDIKKDCFDLGGGRVADCEDMKYAMKDIPAFIEEEYMTNKDNYLSKIEFELAEIRHFDGTSKKYTTTWKETDRYLKLNKSIGKQIKNESFFKKNIPIELLNIPDELTRATDIYNFIKDHFVWNRENKIFADIDVKEAFEGGIGNISEINLALINALQVANIDAKIMLSATRNYGLPTKVHPVVTDFNYVLAYVKIKNQNYLLDASDKLLPFGMISFRALNSYGRVLDFKNGSFWYDIDSKSKTYSRKYLRLKISADSIAGKLKIDDKGYFALSKRNRIIDYSEDDYILSVENESKNISISNYKNSNLKNFDKTLIEEMEIELDNREAVGDLIYFNPFVLNKMESNPFNLTNRTYPVDFGYKQNETLIITIEIPENYEVKSIPESVSIVLPLKGGSYVAKIKSNENSINIFTRLDLNKSVYQPQEYPYLKEIYNQIIKTQNSLITLEKI